MNQSNILTWSNESQQGNVGFWRWVHTHIHIKHTATLHGKTGKQTSTVLNVKKAGCLGTFPPGEKHYQNKLNLLSPRSPNTGRFMPTSERTFLPVHLRLALGRCQVLESCYMACEVSVPVGAPALCADDGIQRPPVCNSLGQCNDKNLTKPLTAWASSQFCPGIWTGRPVFNHTQKFTNHYEEQL